MPRRKLSKEEKKVRLMTIYVGPKYIGKIDKQKVNQFINQLQEEAQKNKIMAYDSTRADLDFLNPHENEEPDTEFYSDLPSECMKYCESRDGYIDYTEAWEMLQESVDTIEQDVLDVRDELSLLVDGLLQSKRVNYYVINKLNRIREKLRKYDNR